MVLRGAIPQYSPCERDGRETLLVVFQFNFRPKTRLTSGVPRLVNVSRLNEWENRIERLQLSTRENRHPL